MLFRIKRYYFSLLTGEGEEGAEALVDYNNAHRNEPISNS